MRYVRSTGKMSVAYKILVGKPERNRSWGVDDRGKL